MQELQSLLDPILKDLSVERDDVHKFLHQTVVFSAVFALVKACVGYNVDGLADAVRDIVPFCRRDRGALLYHTRSRLMGWCLQFLKQFVDELRVRLQPAVLLLGLWFERFLQLKSQLF